MSETNTGILPAYIRAFRLVFACSPPYVIALFALTAVAAAIQPAQIWLTKLLIDSVSISGREAIEYAVAVVLAVGGLWVSAEMCGGFSETVYRLLGFKVANHIRAEVLRKLSTVDYPLYENPELLDKLQNASGRAEPAAINSCFASTEILKIGLSAIGLMLLLSRLSPLAPVAIIVCVLPRVFWGFYYSRAYFRIFLDHTPERRMGNSLARILTSAAAAKEVRIFNSGPMLIGRATSLWERFWEETRRLMFARQKWNVIVSIISSMGVAGVWYYAVRQAVGGEDTIGDLALYLQTAVAGNVTIASLAIRFRDLLDNRLYLKHLFDFLDLDESRIPGALARPTSPGGCFSLERGIVFRNVSFTYPGTKAGVLHNLNLEIPAGASIGLVGRNGVGKTTLIKLLTRLYDPTDGEILIDGTPIKNIPVVEYYRHIGGIFQDFVRYELTFRENVGIANQAALQDDQVIVSAIRDVGAESLLKGMANGLETVLSRGYKDGVELSEGEWQKVALARALVKTEADILILDEPTASLDVYTEQKIFETFADITKGRTSVLISHRFSTVRSMDIVAVMDDGQIVEQGSHDELMDLKGLYHDMFTTQARLYNSSGWQ